MPIQGAMRLAAATALALGCLLFAAPPALSAAAADAGLSAQLTAAVNAVRAAHGLQPLAVSPGLVAAATAHSQDMAERGYFDHDTAGGATWDARLRRYYPSSSVGENIAWASPSIDADGIVAMWLGSPPHRENLLSPRWRELGVGAVRSTSAPGEFGGHEVTVVTLDFGAGSAAVPARPVPVKPTDPPAAAPAAAAPAPAGADHAAAPAQENAHAGRERTFRPRLLAALSTLVARERAQVAGRWAARR